jgi:hypothetical protein
MVNVFQCGGGVRLGCVLVCVRYLCQRKILLTDIR